MENSISDRPSSDDLCWGEDSSPMKTLTSVRVLTVTYCYHLQHLMDQYDMDCRLLSWWQSWTAQRIDSKKTTACQAVDDTGESWWCKSGGGGNFLKQESFSLLECHAISSYGDARCRSLCCYPFWCRILPKLFKALASNTHLKQLQRWHVPWWYSWWFRHTRALSANPSCICLVCCWSMSSMFKAHHQFPHVLRATFATLAWKALESWRSLYFAGPVTDLLLCMSCQDVGQHWPGIWQGPMS